MNKTKLAICIRDQEYQARFVNCFMNHYKDKYELHVFSDMEQLIQAEKMEYPAIITEDYSTEELAIFVERRVIVILLADARPEDNKEELVHLIEKYQEVYRIEEQIQRILGDKITQNHSSCIQSGYKCIGIYSLTQEAYQIPFTALLGKIVGKTERVLILDLQNYSGLSKLGGASSMGLEDLLSVVSTGNYCKSRLLDCIHREADYDYIYPVHNHQCLIEGSKAIYDELLRILVQEFGYEYILINFGAMFTGQIDMMAQCHSFYLLRSKDATINWREEAFFQELERQEKQDFLIHITNIEIPSNGSREEDWNVIADKWNWGSLGETVRHLMEKERQNGANL